MLHLPQLYKYHKKHHEIHAPIGAGALYMGVLDFYLNIISVILPLIILSSHPIVVHIWIFLTTTNVIIISHSGYKNWSEFHDRHHQYFRYNFGIGGLMDKLCGTYYYDK